MKSCAALLAALAFVVGCKGKHETPPVAQGSAPASQPEAPALKPSQEPLPQLPPLDPETDPKHTEKAELGHVLFFDKRLSANNDLACISCHKNEDGTGGHDPVAIGSGGQKQARNAPALWNTGYFKGAWYWDGRATTLEDNAKGEWGGGNMGVGADNLDKKAAQIAAIPGYKKLFEAAGFTEIKADAIAQALAAYERTLLCTDTAYDKFAAGDKTALTEQQQRGLDTFLAKGQCLVCHAPPYFSTAMAGQGVYFNAGIGTDVPEDQVDVGRMKVTGAQTDWAAFKPPSLRNVSRTPPYFHNGSVAHLEDAVKLMATGGLKNKNLNPILGARGLTDGDVADLVAFLHALDCSGTLAEPKLP